MVKTKFDLNSPPDFKDLHTTYGGHHMYCEICLMMCAYDHQAQRHLFSITNNKHTTWSQKLHVQNPGCKMKAHIFSISSRASNGLPCVVKAHKLLLSESINLFI